MNKWINKIKIESLPPAPLENGRTDAPLLFPNKRTGGSFPSDERNALKIIAAGDSGLCGRLRGGSRRESHNGDIMLGKNIYAVEWNEMKTSKPLWNLWRGLLNNGNISILFIIIE